VIVSYTALVAEDEPQMASIISFALETEGFKVTRVVNGFDAWEAIQRDQFDVIVLDVMMPRVDGLEVCRRTRALAERSTVAILVVTAKAGPDEIITGLEAGADDYLAKPFHPRELALRASALARRSHRKPASLSQEVVVSSPSAGGALTVDLDRFEAFLDGRPLRVTTNEIRMLSCLVQNPGKAISWEQLLKEAWGVDSWEGGREMVKAAVYRLRQKLDDDPHEPRFIVAVRGVGYKLLLQ
jgi:DNA-binding response OmpR family regulator